MTYPLNSYGGIMGQTVVTSLPLLGSAGYLYDSHSAMNGRISTFTTTEPLAFGLGVFTVPSVPTGSTLAPSTLIQLPHPQAAVLGCPVYLPIDSVTTIIINGVTVTVTATSTDASTNLTEIASALATQPNISSATSNPSQNNITVTATTGNTVSITEANSVVTTGSGVSSTEQWIVATSTASQFWGVSVSDATLTNAYAPPPTSGVISGSALPYAANKPAGILQASGRIWVVAEQTNSTGTSTPITNSSPVYVRTIPTALNPVVGAFRSDADSGNAILLPTSCVQWIFGTDITNTSLGVLNVTTVQGG